MVDIERLKRKELSAWFEDFKAQIAQKEDIVFVDDGKAYKAVDYLNLDGFYPGYFSAKRRVLFIGRESREVSGCNRMETDIEFLRNNNINKVGFAFWQRVFYVVYGIQHEGKVPFRVIPYANEIKEACVKANSFPFAFINLSKYSNDSKSWKADYVLMNRFLEDAELGRRNYLREQISILDPDIIISCNLWGDARIDLDKLDLIFPPDDFSKRIPKLSTEGISDVYNFSFEGKNIRFIDLHHFSAIRVGKLMGYELDKLYFYDPVMKAVFGNQEAVE